MPTLRVWAYPASGARTRQGKLIRDNKKAVVLEHIYFAARRFGAGSRKIIQRRDAQI